MDVIKTKNSNFTLRFGKPEDAGLALEFMKKLGKYQKMLDKITATEEGIFKLLSEKRGEIIFGDYNGKTEAFLYFYQNSSAFIGEKGIYIDAFYMNETMRLKGLGKIMMAFMSKLAMERGCKRLEWGCLDWNEPAVKFYKELGAVGVDPMTIYRFTPEILKKNADRFHE